MKPEINIHNRDCLEAMAEMPDNAYELAIVDPPYGINMDGGSRQYNKYKRKNWDKNIPDKVYFNELSRVSKNQIIWGGNYYNLPPTPCFLIWDKTFRGNTFADCEMAWTSFKSPARIKSMNICHIQKNGIKRIHPTQKPVALYKWLLKNYASEGDWVLDTHLGSGSIAIACHDFGFNLTGFEIDEEYYKAALDRLNTHRSQMQLF